MTRAEQAAQSRLIEIAGYKIRLPEGRVRHDRDAVTYDLRPLYEALKPFCEEPAP